MEQNKLYEIATHYSQEAAVIGKQCSTFRLLVISDEYIAKHESAHICIQNISNWKLIINLPKSVITLSYTKNCESD
jgi:hypothetical protein